MPEDDFMKKMGYPGATAKAPAPGEAAAAPEAAPEAPSGDYTPAGRVGRGLAKSFVGTATGVPRGINALIGSERLGDLAERMPGVKRAEEFAASPNETWSETAGYYGGEALQWLTGPGEIKFGLKLAEKYPWMAEKLATKIPGKLDVGASMAERKAAEAGIPAAFKPGLTPVVSRAHEVEAARGDLGKLAEIIGRERAEITASTAAKEAPRAARAAPGQGGVLDLRGEGGIPGKHKTFRLDPITHQAENQLTRGDRARELGIKSAGAAAQGAVMGAATDPDDPGTGAALGAVTGGLTPGVGKFMTTKPGQWMADMSARHGASAAIGVIAHQLGVPIEYLIGALLPYWRWHSAPGAKWLGERGKRAASTLGPILENASGRGPGIAAGSLGSLLGQSGGASFTEQDNGEGGEASATQ